MIWRTGGSHPICGLVVNKNDGGTLCDRHDGPPSSSSAVGDDEEEGAFLLLNVSSSSSSSTNTKAGLSKKKN